MTRIIAGVAGGRRVSVPPGRRTRPTADRVREGLFSTLEVLAGSLRGARFLDLYSGSGAVGLEAVSRGAGHALLVESDFRAGRVIMANVARLDLRNAHVHIGPVEKLVGRPCDERGYDVVFADPPYDVPDDELRAVLAAAHHNAWFAADAVLAVERPSRGTAWAWPASMAAERFRRYGEATLWYGRAAGSSGVDEAFADPASPQPAQE